MFLFLYNKVAVAHAFSLLAMCYSFGLVFIYLSQENQLAFSCMNVGLKNVGNMKNGNPVCMNI